MRTALYILLGTATLLIFVVLGIERWLGARLRRAVEKTLAERMGGAVELTVGRVGVSLWSRTVTVRDVTVRSDGSRLAPFLPGVETLEADISRIALRHIRFRLGKSAPDRPKYLSLRSVEIDAPRIVCTVNGDRTPDSVKTGVASRLRETICARLGSLSVERIVLHHGEIQAVEPGQNRYAAKGVTAEAAGFLISSEASVESRPLFCDDLRIAVQKASAHFLVTAQLLEVGPAELSVRDERLLLENIRLVPQYAKADYAWKTEHHTDWTLVLASGVEAEGVDFGRLWREGSVSVGRISVRDAEVASFKNRRIVRQERFKPLWHEMIHRLPFGLEVGTVEIVRARVVYEELAATGTAPGRISFDDLNGALRGLTNRPSAPDSMYTLTASGKVMNTGQLRVVVRIPAALSNDRFEAEGTLGPMSLDLFNRILQPLADAGIRTGRLEGLSFSISGDSRTAQATVKMRYEDLSVRLLRRDGDPRRRERKWASGFVNLLVIRSSNPDRKGLRTSRSTVERDPLRSQFNYLWRGVLGGIKESVGLPETPSAGKNLRPADRKANRERDKE